MNTELGMLPTIWPSDMDGNNIWKLKFSNLPYLLKNSVSVKKVHM